MLFRSITSLLADRWVVSSCGSSQDQHTQQYNSWAQISCLNSRFACVRTCCATGSLVVASQLANKRTCQCEVVTQL